MQVWIHQWLWNDAQSLKSHWRGALLFFKVIRPIARSHGSRNCQFWPKFSVSGLYLHFEITDGYEMMHKAWSSIEEVPYCFSKSYIQSQGHTALTIVDFDPNWAFPDCNSSLDSPMATKWCTKHEVEQKRCPIVYQGHTSNCKVTRLKKILDFDPNWGFPDCNASLNSPMAMKWCTKLEVALKRCPFVFQGHTSNCKVTWL